MSKMQSRADHSMMRRWLHRLDRSATGTSTPSPTVERG